MTIHHEWKDSIEFLINPYIAEYEKYFNGYWDEEMVKKFFQHQSKSK